MKIRFKIFFLFVGIFCSSFFFGQNKKTDSLLALLKTAGEDTAKVRMLTDLSKAFILQSAYADAVTYAQQGIDLAQKLKFQKGEGNALSNLALADFYLGKVEDALRLNALALQIREKINDQAGIALTHNNLSIIYFTRGEYETAMQHCSVALSIRLKIADNKGICDTYINIGNIYATKGLDPEALKVFLTALTYAEKENYKTGIARASNNIGNIYKDVKNYPLALKYYQSSFEMKKSLGDRMGTAVSLSNIGNIYMKLEKFPEALTNFNEALKINTEDKRKSAVGRNYNIIGVLYTTMHDLKNALPNFQEALKINRELGDAEATADVLINLGDLMQDEVLEVKGKVREKNLIQAEKYFNEALEISIGIRALNRMNTAYLRLSELAAADGDFKKSFALYKLHIVYRDSVTNEANTKKLIQSQMQYDFDKKSAADSIKNSEAKKFEEIKHQQEISKQRTFTYGGITGFLVMIIVAGISYRAFRNKKKANIEIQHQKELVEEKQKEILDSIYYARRIQRALITSEKYIGRKLNELNHK